MSEILSTLLTSAPTWLQITLATILLLWVLQPLVMTVLVLRDPREGTKMRLPRKGGEIESGTYPTAKPSRTAQTGGDEVQEK